MLYGKRMVIFSAKNNQTIYKKPDSSSRPIVHVEPNVIAELLECIADWCKVKVEGNRGWVERRMLWGIYPTEEID